MIKKICTIKEKYVTFQQVAGIPQDQSTLQQQNTNASHFETSPNAGARFQAAAYRERLGPLKGLRPQNGPRSHLPGSTS